jgi:heme-degrading monooxygenase HmoA
VIARVWEGSVRRDDAQEYGEYILATGFAEYTETPGNRGAWLLRRDEPDRTVFVALSMWDSREAIHAFAGDDIDASHLYPEDQRYLLGGRSSVTHFDVVAGTSSQIPDDQPA